MKSFAAGPLEFHLEFDDFELFSAKNEVIAVSPLSNFDDGMAQAVTGGAWLYDWEQAPESAFELIAPGRGGRGFAAQVGGNLDGASNSQLRAIFRKNGSPMDLSQFDGIQFWVRGDGQFQFQSLQPSITDSDNYSTPATDGTPEWKQARVWFKELKQAAGAFRNPWP